MEESDIIPADLNNTIVYRQARQEAIDSGLQLNKFPGKPLESLLMILQESEIVHIFSTCPFILIFFTKSQIKLWNEAYSLPNLETSLDASGSFVRKVQNFK